MRMSHVMEKEILYCQFQALCSKKSLKKTLKKTKSLWNIKNLYFSQVFHQNCLLKLLIIKVSFSTKNH